ncbi:phosphoribosylglycinamide formyltransferase, partial [Providencia vermicola]
MVVLISGSGSNLQSLIDSCHSGEIDAQIAAVVSNQGNAYGLVRAQKAGIPAF